MDKEEFFARLEKESEERISHIHHFAKKIWGRKKLKPIDIRNKCLDIWDEMQYDIDTRIVPLVNVVEERKPTNLIFGSGSFSTGRFQAEQYEIIKKLTDNNAPVVLEGIVANKSEDHGCKAEEVAKSYNLPLVQLDFIDWYHEFVDKNAQNPIAATRYWFDEKDPNIPGLGEISRRFKIRQEQFHGALGDLIAKNIKKPIDIVSLRGYNFQVCSNIFKHQGNSIPHFNDTHPADLSFVDPKSKTKLYAGWQSGAVDKMIKDGVHSVYRGSLIEVLPMDNISQIYELDEGALMGLGRGVEPPGELKNELTAKDIQQGLKIMDDYMFCSWEASGLILAFGITEKPVPVIFQDLSGNKVILKQRAIVVGDKYYSGIYAFGQDIENELKKLEEFILNLQD